MQRGGLDQKIGNAIIFQMNGARLGVAHGIVLHSKRGFAVDQAALKFTWYAPNLRILITPVSSIRYWPLIPSNCPSMVGVFSRSRLTTLSGCCSTGYEIATASASRSG